MKSLFSLVFILFLGFFSFSQEKNAFDVLSKAQNNIDNAFLKSFKSGVNYLKQIEKDLESIDNKKSLNIQFYKKYWLSYLKYKEAIFLLKNVDRENSEKKISEAIAQLESIPNKDSEVYSLLSLEQSFNFQFIPRQEFIVYMKRIDENLEKAITLNHKNLRAYYVNASYDFYTPEEYGGGAKTEKYLLKAITLNDRTSTSTFSPHWGKELSYGLLIEYYIKKKNKRLAEKYYQESVKKYPNSNYFNRYLKLIDNI